MVKVKIPKFSKTFAFLERTKKFDPVRILHKYGAVGVKNLSRETPKDTGETASGWAYKVDGNRDRYRLIWTNNKTTPTGTPIVLLLQYGHGTKSGYYVPGKDFINPALKPVYDSILREIGQEVHK
jgi:hypothetical protein